MLTARPSHSANALFASVSLGAMAFVMLAQSRVMFALSDSDRLHIGYLVLSLAAAIAAVRAVLWRPADFSRRSWAIRSWPLLAAFAVNLGYLGYAFLNRNDPRVALVMPPMRMLDIALALAAAPASYFLGLMTRDIRSRKIAYFLVGIALVSAAVGVVQYAAGIGIHTPVARALASMNADYAVRHYMWHPQPQDSLRVTGLETWPFLYSYLAVIVAAWALATTESTALRVTAFVSATLIVALSGTRAIMLAMGVMVVSWAFAGVSVSGAREWAKANAAMLATVVVITALALVGTFAVPSNWQTPFVRGGPTADAATPTAALVPTPAISTTLNGRAFVWKRALAFLRAHPFGTGIPYEAMTGWGHTHNDVLECLVWGGPLMLLGYLGTALWVILCVKTPSAPKLGLLVGLGMLAAGLTDMATLSQPLGAPAFFLLGALADRRWSDTAKDLSLPWCG